LEHPLTTQRVVQCLEPAIHTGKFNRLSVLSFLIFEMIERCQIFQLFPFLGTKLDSQDKTAIFTCQ